MSTSFMWLTRCEIEAGVPGFSFMCDSRKAADGFAEAYRRDGFINITVERVEVNAGDGLRNGSPAYSTEVSEDTFLDAIP